MLCYNSQRFSFSSSVAIFSSIEWNSSFTYCRWRITSWLQLEKNCCYKNMDKFNSWYDILCFHILTLYAESTLNTTLAKSFRFSLFYETLTSRGVNKIWNAVNKVGFNITSTYNTLCIKAILLCCMLSSFYKISSMKKRIHIALNAEFTYLHGRGFIVLVRIFALALLLCKLRMQLRIVILSRCHRNKFKCCSLKANRMYSCLRQMSQSPFLLYERNRFKFSISRPNKMLVESIVRSSQLFTYIASSSFPKILQKLLQRNFYAFSYRFLFCGCW